jgi:hypothetical protein
VDRKAWLCHDWRMRIVLSNPRVFPKRLVFFAAACFLLVVGISVRGVQYFSQEKAAVTTAAPQPPPAAAPVAPTQSLPKVPPAAKTAPAAPSEQAKQAAPPVEPAKPVEQAKQASDMADQTAPQGPILVSKRPIEVLASPSASAAVMYGFPAGRPFRLIGRQGNFAQIQDLKSGASGWIDESAVVPPPRAPVASARSEPSAASGNRKPTAASANVKPKAPTRGRQSGTEVAAEPDADQTSERSGFLGLGRKGGGGGLAGFLGKVFSPLANGNGN